MTKRCRGCGAILQNTNLNVLGYTPNLNNKLCARCFKMNNYGLKSVPNLNMDNKSIIKKLNSKYPVFFLVDFLSLTKEVLNTYHQISNPKTLVITKIDTLPKSLKFAKISTYLKDYYDIKENIIYLSSKNKISINTIFNTLDTKKAHTAYLVGYTNSGKSSLINALTNQSLTTSYLPNTTTDYLKIKIDNYTLIDTPGLNYSKTIYNLDDYDLIKKITLSSKLKAYNYQTKEDTIINILDLITLKVGNSNKVTIYIQDKVIPKKIYHDKLDFTQETMQINANSDIIIVGVCLINIKNPCNLEIKIQDKDLLEIRPSLFS